MSELMLWHPIPFNRFRTISEMDGRVEDVIQVMHAASFTLIPLRQHCRIEASIDGITWVSMADPSVLQRHCMALARGEN